jgi:hypothetical protein
MALDIRHDRRSMGCWAWYAGVGLEQEAWYGKASRIEGSKQFSSILNICK